MLGNLFHLLLLNSYASSSHVENTEVVNRFITAFNDHETLSYWFRNGSNVYENALLLTNDLIIKIRELLALINIEQYKGLKSLIMNTDMRTPSDLSFSYYETFIIIRSIRRIITINDDYKSPGITNDLLLRVYGGAIQLTESIYKYILDLNRFNEKLLFDEIIRIEYACIYNDVVNVISLIKSEYLFRDILILSMSERYLMTCVYFHSILKEYVDFHFTISRITVDDELMLIDRPEPIFVLALSTGISYSKKCYNSLAGLYLKYEHLIVSSTPKLQFKDRTYIKRGVYQQAKMEDYMNRSFLYNRSTTQLLLVLFHYYSVINDKDTVYEIEMKTDNLYEIKWLYSEKPSTDDIKKYYLKNEIYDLSKWPLIHKFSLIVEYDLAYSTVKSDDTEDVPITTRLIVLSCGHQLGFDLIDEFFESIYKGPSESTKCQICRRYIAIVGSYTTVVYKCK